MGRKLFLNQLAAAMNAGLRYSSGVSGVPWSSFLLEGKRINHVFQNSFISPRTSSLNKKINLIHTWYMQSLTEIVQVCV